MQYRLSQFLILPVLALCVAVLAPRPAVASDLSDAFLLPELFDIMAEEGRASMLADGATPLQGSALRAFQDDVAAIYTADRMLAAFLTEMEKELSSRPDVRADALDFAATDAGKQILQLEIAARQALLEDEIDEMARMTLLEAREAARDSAMAARLDLVRQRIDANDLIELNVSLGLNTSFAYYRGMMAENAVQGLSADMLLQLVWAQEPAIRADIEDWIESYFLMAYQPLSTDEMEAFVAYVATPLAQDFNRAMFRAFDTVFSEISLQVGHALGRRLSIEEL